MNQRDRATPAGRVIGRGTLNEVRAQVPEFNRQAE